MTHHDGVWGILGSQRDEDQARAQAASDPATYHSAIAAKELHWYDTSAEQWVSQTGTDAWQGWHAGSGAASSADAGWTPWSSALDASAAPFYRWFVDGQTNACFNLLDRHVLSGRGEKQALVFEGDRWDPSKNEGRGGPVFEQRLSYRELLVEVPARAGTQKPRPQRWGPHCAEPAQYPRANLLHPGRAAARRDLHPRFRRILSQNPI